LPGFRYTQHFATNPMVDAVEAGHAECLCYITIEHFLPNDIVEPYWIIKGFYRFGLQRDAHHNWVISHFKIYPTSEYGDRKIIDIAQMQAKTSPRTVDTSLIH
jgi:hypothetical protein